MIWALCEPVCDDALSALPALLSFDPAAILREAEPLSDEVSSRVCWNLSVCWSFDVLRKSLTLANAATRSAPPMMSRLSMARRALGRAMPSSKR